MAGVDNAGRWGGRVSRTDRSRVPAPTASAKRTSVRELVTIVAGAAAVAGIGYALTVPDGPSDGVVLSPANAATDGGTADLSPVERTWDAMTATSGASAFRVGSAQPVADLDLRARSESEHIEQTQSFAGVMMPRLNDGQVTGFTVRDGTMPPVLARADVRPGDVMVSVNDRALDSNAVVSRLSRDLAEAHRADIVVERGGTRVTLSTSLRG